MGNLEQKVSPKLKEVRRQIEALLDKYDVAGHVILHEPGNLYEGGMGLGEVFIHQPSYCVLTIAGPIARFKSKREDYKGDTAAQHRDQVATLNMVTHFADLLAMGAVYFIDLKKVLDTKLGATHREGEFTPDPSEGLH